MISMAFVLPLFLYSAERQPNILKTSEEHISELKAIYEQNNESFIKYNDTIVQWRQKRDELMKELERQEKEHLYATIGLVLICVGIATIIGLLEERGTDVIVPTTPFAVVPIAAVLVAPIINEAKLAAPAA